MIFGTGFQANYATLSALTEKGDVMICDHNLHASLVEGALRSPGADRCVSGTTIWITSSGAWRTARPEEKIFIVSEGVFSMEGDIADLRGLVRRGQAVWRAHLRG